MKLQTALLYVHVTVTHDTSAARPHSHCSCKIDVYWILALGPIRLRARVQFSLAVVTNNYILLLR